MILTLGVSGGYNSLTDDNNYSELIAIYNTLMREEVRGNVVGM